MKHLYPGFILLLLIAMSMISCSKEIIMPEEVADELSGETYTPRNPDSLRLNFLWIRPNASSAQVPGARFQLLNDTGAVLINTLDIMSGDDSVFVFSPSRGLDPGSYFMTVKSPSGAVIDTTTIDFNTDDFSDEIRIDKPNVTYYLQITWLHKVIPVEPAQ